MNLLVRGLAVNYRFGAENVLPRKQAFTAILGSLDAQP